MPAIEHEIGRTMVPDGVELRLIQQGDEFAILLEDTTLMSTLVSASEEALATMTAQRLGVRPASEWLIGGYGMGYTLRAVLAEVGSDAGVTLAEIVPAIIEWARGPMHALTAGCLDDPRVMLVQDDVAMLIEAARDAYDAILLDVDNGPEGITRLDNDHLYSTRGLKAARRALRPGGILAVWSCEPFQGFTIRLRRAGFEVEMTHVRARAGDQGAHHVIWFARNPAAQPSASDTDICTWPAWRECAPIDRAHWLGFTGE